MKNALFVVLMMVMATGLYAGKAPNITTSGTIELPMVFEAPEVQDLTSNEILLYKTVYDNFIPVYTTMSLTLFQNHKGKVVGTAHFGTYLNDAGATVVESLTVTSLSGKLKNGKTKKGVEYGPTFHVNASTSISEIIYKVRVSGVMDKDAFEPSFDLDDPDEFATAYYDVEVKVTGLARTYFYTLEDVPVQGNFHFRYVYPTEEEMPRKQKPEKYEYFKVIAPWGEGVVKGTFSVTGDFAEFNLKGPKFKFEATESGFGGFDFFPDVYTLKTGMGKSAGDHP